MQRFACCVPWNSPFVFLKFARLALNLEPPSGWRVKWFFGNGSMPAERHVDACEQALAWNADLLCILGADQEYQDEDMLCRLLARWEEVGGHGIVAALVPMRGYVDWNEGSKPFQPQAWRLESTHEIVDGKVIVHETRHLIRREDGPFQRAHLIGSGVTLFHREVILGLRQPWFFERVDPLTMRRIADQDSYALYRMQVETHTPLYVDTTIRVAHDHVMSIDDSFQERFANWADPTTPGIDRSICRFRAELPGMTSVDVTLADHPRES